MEERDLGVEEVFGRWLSHNLGWWFNTAIWVMKWWRELNYHYLLMTLGVGAVLWLYPQTSNSWIWLAVFIANIFVSAVFYWLYDVYGTPLAWDLLFFSEGAQFVLFLIVLKSVLEWWMQMGVISR